MLWRNDADSERAFKMYNRYSNKCLSISKYKKGFAIMTRCEKNYEQMIDFKKR